LGWLALDKTGVPGTQMLVKLLLHCTAAVVVVVAIVARC